MKFYFKLMTLLYLGTGVLAIILTIYFQSQGRRDEAIFALIAVFVCGLMLGIRNWQKRRLERLEKDMQAKYEEEIKTRKEKKAKE